MGDYDYPTQGHVSASGSDSASDSAPKSGSTAGRSPASVSDQASAAVFEEDSDGDASVSPGQLDQRAPASAELTLALSDLFDNDADLAAALFGDDHDASLRPPLATRALTTLIARAVSIVSTAQPSDDATCIARLTRVVRVLKGSQPPQWQPPYQCFNDTFGGVRGPTIYNAICKATTHTPASGGQGL